MNLFIDFETRSSVDIRKSGSFKYIEAEDFEVLLTAYAYNGEPVKVTEKVPLELIGYLKDGTIEDKIIVHNRMFEAPVFDRIYCHIDPERIIDTMQLARSVSYPAALKPLSVFLGKSHKLDTGTALIRKFCCPPYVNPEDDPEAWEKFKEYAERDVVAMREIYESLNSNLVPDPVSEAIRNLDYKINARGIKLDVPLIKNAIELANKSRATLAKDFKNLTGLNHTQVIKVAEWIRNNGYDIENLRAQTIREALELSDPPLRPKLKCALQVKAMLSKTSVKKLDTMLRYACKDDRARGMFIYHKATTGRWGGSGIQLQNMPRPTIKDVDKAIAAIQRKDMKAIKSMGNPLDVIASTLRGMLIPSEGKKFAVLDFSSIEAIALVWLTGQEDILDNYRNGIDAYKTMAARIYNVSPEDVNKEQRMLGKVAVLALGYGMGTTKFVITAHNWGIEISERLASKSRDAFHASYFKAVKYWKACHNAFVRTVTQKTRSVIKTRYASVAFEMHGADLHIILPSGRRLSYPKACMMTTRAPWDDLIQSPSFYGQEVGRADWRMQTTYSGKLFNNIIQGIACDFLANAMLNLEKAGFFITAHVHDEVVLEVNKGKDYNKAKTIMEKVPSWAEGTCLKAEGGIISRYGKV